MNLSPFVIDGPTCYSFSMGRSSGFGLRMVLDANPPEVIAKYLRVLTCNTGKEDEASLLFWRDVQRHWGAPMTMLEYVGASGFREVTYETASRNGEPYEAVIAQRGGYLPNRVARYCSSELKTRTMHRYLRSIGWTEWDTILGIRADEPRRVAKFRANPHPEGRFEEVHMPLAIAGIGAAEVGAFWRSQPFDLELPNNNGKTMHGNCDLCFLKPAAQVLSLISEKPERAIWWAQQESKAESVAGSAAKFRDDRPDYSEMLRFAKEQSDMFDHGEEAIACYCGD